MSNKSLFTTICPHCLNETSYISIDGNFLECSECNNLVYTDDSTFGLLEILNQVEYANN